MHTTEKLRTTAIALFPEEATEAEAQAVVERLASVTDMAGFQTVLRKTILSDGSKRAYIKFSKIVPRNDLGTGWVVNITAKLFEAGYEDVAWRLTRILPDGGEGEATTESFPVELFKAALAEDGDDGC